MEIHLLKGRFPNSSLVESCGNLKNVFFCARNVNTHSYEGRLFITDTALFFVSSYSSTMSFDKEFELSRIVEVIVPRKVIPSVEFKLTNGKEYFTNFHNMVKFTDTFKSMLPNKITLEHSKQGVYPNFNRLVSVPGKCPPNANARRYRMSQKLEPCPYYSRSGFCPRQELCQFTHCLNSPIIPLTVEPSNFKHTSPDRMKNLRPYGQELSRSISSPACGADSNQHQTDTAMIGITTSDNEINVSSIQEAELRLEMPHPVQQFDSTQQLIAGICTPVLPSPFGFTNQRKNAVGNVYPVQEVIQDGSIPIPPPPPPLPADRNYAGYELSDEEYYDEHQFSPVVMPDTLTVYPATHIQRGDINSGDKVILSAEILMACEQKQITYPMAFCFKNKQSNAFVHAGVLEFTSPLEKTVYLPQWMFEHLNVSNGEEVDFQHVDLPKGTFVQLQPVSSAWLGVPYEKRMAILEFQLRNFQTLTEGTKVTIVYELNRYTFKVLLCKPAKGISIVDSDLTTDVVEPADFNRFHSVEEWQAENIPLSEPIHCTVAAGCYRHFVLLSQPGRELPPKLHVEVKNKFGDPDLFLCQTCSTPSQSRYTWCNQNIGDCTLHLSTGDKDYNTQKSLFAGVISLTEDSEFTICFDEDMSNSTSASAGNSSGHVLKSATNDSTSSTGDNETRSGFISEETDGEPTIPPGHGQCAYCGSIMPQLKLLMHERHCAQSTFKCPICKECFPKSFEKKHELIAHKLLICECGEKLSQLSLHNHQLTQCIKRSVKCQFKWCQLSFPLDQIQNHESVCGRKLINCPVCSVEVSQLELQIHLEVFHQLLANQIDWSKPISSQMSFKPNFKCHCGTGFQFQDDLQVHQLTECTPEFTN